MTKKKDNRKLNSQLPTPNSLFITGTDTGIGKTTVAALLIMLYRRAGIDIGFMKPVQSGAARNRGKLCSQDAALMAKAAGGIVEINNNPYCYEESLSPYLAAKRAGETVSIERIKTDYRSLSQKHQAVIVEGAGGLLTPLTKDKYMVDLAAELDLPLVIVADAQLGTLNHTLLTIQAAEAAGLEILGLVVNGYPENPGTAEATNLSELERVTGLPVLLVVPEFEGFSIDSADLKPLVDFINRIDADRILNHLRKFELDGKRLVNDDLKYVWHPFTQMKEYEAEEPHPVIIARGRGSYLIDTEGKRYLDGVSSLWVNVHGHREAELDWALIRQIGKISHSTLLGLSNVPAVELAKKLVEITPPGLEKVFYSDNGSTAVEAALKIAFQYWQQQPGGARKQRFVGFVNAYHGDTLGSVSVGGIDLFHEKHRPLLFESFKADSAYCYRCPLSLNYPNCSLACLNKLENILGHYHEEIAAVIVEPKVQAAAGMLISPPGYLRRIEELAIRYNVLIIADEVATGFGRTGKMFACELENIEPDIMCLAKGLTGGYLPLAATIVSKRIFDAFYDEYPKFKTFFHGHTYTGNPLACSAAIANIDLFESESVLDKLGPKIDLLTKRLLGFKRLEKVGDIRQCGFMVGIELVNDSTIREPYKSDIRLGRRVILEARRRGAIIRPLGDIIVLMPPLAISEKELTELLEITYQSIEKVTDEVL